MQDNTKQTKERAAGVIFQVYVSDLLLLLTPNPLLPGKIEKPHPNTSTSLPFAVSLLFPTTS